MAALISKPGITSASTLSIPKNWDATWFRQLIQRQLKGADVRNAVGVNGIVVSGNLASPYATIGFGGAANPITGPVIINGTASTTALTVNAGSSSNAANFVGNSGVPFLGNTHLAVRIAGATGTTDYSGIDFSSTNANPQARIAAVFAGGGSSLQLGTSNNYATGITNTALTIGPTGSSTFSAAIGVNGNAPPAQSTGWGTPVGGAVVLSYNITDAGGANSNTNKALAQVITVLKAVGILGA